MKHLLDVSTLIALIWPSHVFSGRANAWREGKTIVLCPITELGYLVVTRPFPYSLSSVASDEGGSLSRFPAFRFGFAHFCFLLSQFLL
ncbi:MAG: hypothetical protein ABSE16_10130 [Verrucomicrobiota bacterium]|jgi:predicted nucleic acid-binding protein